MSTALLHTVRRTIRRHRLAVAETRVAVAVSGGSDSVALLSLLLDLQRAGELCVAGVAHFNHRLRFEADADEQFCRAHAAALGLPFVAGAEDVAARARLGGRSIEAAAHDARYAFFERARTALDADVVALGHTKDDQAETFLLRMVRGAGARGLASMHPKRGAIVRPLLDCRRHELREHLDASGRSYRIDSSNADVSIPRNRVRAELLPLLEARFNPSVVDVLAHEAEMLRAQHEFMAQQAEAWLDAAADDVPGGVSIDAAALVAAPRALTRLALLAAMHRLSGSRPVAFADVQQALDVAAGEIPGFDGPGQRVERIGSRVVLTRRPGRYVGRWPTPEGRPNIFQYSLSIPGEVQIGSGAAVSAEMMPGWRGPSDEPAVAAVQMDGPPHLVVRNRRPGDAFRPLGLIGRKKLQDFFVDRKVARDRRDDVPLVVDAADRIIWVAGHAIDEAFRVKDPSQSVIVLRLKGVGGSA